MKNIDFDSKEAPFEGLDWQEAYESVKSDLLALPVDELKPIKLDIPTAVATAAGVIPEVRALRAQIAQDLPGFDLDRFDKLPQYAMATGHTHSMLSVSAGSEDTLHSMYAEAATLREILRSDIKALVKRELLAEESLSAIGGLRGYKNMYADLRNLVNLFRSNWQSIVGKCGTTEAEVDRAADLSSALIQAVGLREQGPSNVDDMAKLRVRAYSIFLSTYGELRRAVAYLRWEEGDVDSIIPSLHRVYGRRTKKVEASPPEVEVSHSHGSDTGADEAPSTTAPTLDGLAKVVSLRPEAPAPDSVERAG